MFEKQQKSKIKIIEKFPLKSKLLLKSTITESQELMCARFGFEDSIMAGGYSDGFIRIFNMNTDNKINQIDTNLSKSQHTPVNCVRWRPATEQMGSISSVILAGNTNGNLYQYVAKTGKQLYHGCQEGNFILSMDYCPDGRSFCTGGKDNQLRIYDEETKQVVSKLTGIKWNTHGHNNRIFSIKYKNDDPNILISGGWDQNVNVWDVREGNVIATLCGPKITGDSIDIEGDNIITGANRGVDQLQLWDWRTQEIKVQFKWDEEKTMTNAFLLGAHFSHHSRDMIIACGGQQMKIFSCDGSELIEVKSQENISLYTCDSGYNSSRYVMGGNSGTHYYFTGIKTSD